ncbi:hypothetical protein GN956_G23266 [Arapaima gigas]
MQWSVRSAALQSNSDDVEDKCLERDPLLGGWNQNLSRTDHIRVTVERSVDSAASSGYILGGAKSHILEGSFTCKLSLLQEVQEVLFAPGRPLIFNSVGLLTAPAVAAVLLQIKSAWKEDELTTSDCSPESSKCVSLPHCHTQS